MRVSSEQLLGKCSDRLTTVDHAHAMQPEAFEAFKQMQSAAANDGVDCQLFSTYRSFDKQCSIWNRKWLGELPLFDIHNQRLEPEQLTVPEKLHAILLWSALPGASRHHWGTDIDVYDQKQVEASASPFNLISDEYCGSGPCAQLSAWLDEHAETFGFYRPYAKYSGGIGPEPWHLSYAPIAKQFECEMDKQILLAAITEANLQGESTIKREFDSIYTRYVLNQGLTSE